MLAVVCGLPGVGKTTIAKEISHQLDGVILRTDIVRKELFEEPTYSERETDQVYAELLSRAKNHLQEGNDVILDGTFRKQKFRKNAKEIANEEDVVFKLIKVQCDVELVQRRMQERTNDASDATFDIYRRYKEKFEPIQQSHITFDNSSTKDHIQRQIADRFGSLQVEK